MASLAIVAAATAATSHARSVPPGEQICVVCLDSHHLLRHVTTSCGHFFCRSCLNEAFFLAAKDESLFPPKCCQQALPTDLALPFVSVRTRCAFEDAKKRVWTQESRLLLQVRVLDFSRRRFRDQDRLDVLQVRHANLLGLQGSEGEVAVRNIRT